jgi:hypothetical protein
MGISGSKLPALNAVNATAQKDDDLDGHDHGVDPGAFLGTSHQQDHREDHDQHGRDVDHAAAPRWLGHRVRQELSERGEGFVHVLPCADGHGSHGDRVFEDEAPTTDPGHAFAHRGVGVGVAGAGNGHEARHFGVGHSREQGSKARHDEGNPDRWSGQRHGFTQDHQDARAEGGADTDHGQLEDAEAADERRTAFAASCFADHLPDRLAAQQLRTEPRAAAGVARICIRGVRWLGLGGGRHSHR